MVFISYSSVQPLKREKGENGLLVRRRGVVHLLFSLHCNVLTVALSATSSTHLLHIIIISFTKPVTGGQEASNIYGGCIQDETNAERRREEG